MNTTLSPVDLFASQRAILTQAETLLAQRETESKRIRTVLADATESADRQAVLALDAANKAVNRVASQYDTANAYLDQAGYRPHRNLPSPHKIKRPDDIQIVDLEKSASLVDTCYTDFRRRILLNPTTSESVRPKAGIGQVGGCSLSLLFWTGPVFLYYWFGDRLQQVGESFLDALNRDALGTIAVVGSLIASDPTPMMTVVSVCFGLAMLVVLRRRLNVSSSYRRLTQAVVDCRYRLDRYTAFIERSQSNAVAEAAASATRSNTELLRVLEPKWMALQSQARDLAIAVEREAPSWDSPSWQKWVPTTTEERVIPLGTYTLGSSELNVSVPAHYDRHAQGTLLIEAQGSAKAEAVAGIQSLVQRLLVSFPPGGARFVFIDPVGLGQLAAPVMRLADLDPALVSNRVWIEPAHIEQRLLDLSEHMQNVIQKYLRTNYADIDAYNAEAGETSESYRFLVISDFPVGFSSAAAERLITIARNGPRCGVYTIVLLDTAQPIPHGFSLQELRRYATLIQHEAGAFKPTEPYSRSTTLLMGIPAEARVCESLLTAIGEGASRRSRVEVPFARVQPILAERWTASSAQGIEAPLGPAGARTLLHLSLGQGTQQHCLVAGQTGSGKTNLLHVLIIGLALRYSPEELELYLIDFKEGVGFKPYATHALPHARVIAIESEREFGISVLQGLDDELERRGREFRAAGAADIAQYRAHTGAPLARLLLIVDEFQAFFAYDDNLASNAGRLLDRLVRQGRSFGIHVLLGSQTLAGIHGFGSSTISQMGVRIALPCQDADSRLILADDNPAARLLSRPGEGIYNAANGLLEGNQLFQAVLMRESDLDTVLRDLSLLAQARSATPLRLTVFEGNSAAYLENNPKLDALLDRPRSITSRVHEAWLGDPVAIRPPVAATLRRQSGSNVLIIGRNEELAFGMVAAAIISLIVQLSPPPADSIKPISLLDLAPASDGNGGLDWDNLAATLSPYLAHGRRRDMTAMLKALAGIVQERSHAREAGGPTGPTLILVIHGLHRATDLAEPFDSDARLDTDGADQREPSPSLAFRTILLDGPEVGIHTIIWANALAGAERVLDRRLMREITLRIAMQVPADDSVTLLETPVASILGPNRAWFHDEEEGQLVKFRPFRAVDKTWLAGFAARLDQREREGAE